MTRHIKSIIIHCAATPNGKWFTAGDIDKWHKDRGFKRSSEFRQRQAPQFAAIGYHFVIYTNGAVAIGRHLDEVGAHAQGFNSKSIGVCLVGTNQFTLEQWSSLRDNVRNLQEHLMLMQGDANPPIVLGHRDLPGVNKECPGFSVAAWMGNDMQPLAGHILDKTGISD